MALEGKEFRPLDISLELPRLFIPAGPRSMTPPWGHRLTESLPFEIVSLKCLLGTDEALGTKHDRITVQEKVRQILAEVKTRSERELQAQITGLAIAVPVCASDRQRAALKAGAEAAGFREVRLVEDSRAAALAYLHTNPPRGKWLVYGLGHSAFFVSVLDVTQGVDTLAHHGDCQLGGEGFDAAIITWLLQQSGASHWPAAPWDHRAALDLYRLAEGLKVRLSGSEDATVTFPQQSSGGRAPVSLTLTRKIFNNLIARDIQRTIELTRQTIAEAGLTPAQIDDVFLLGASTRIPLIKERLQEFLGRAPQEFPVSLVAEGAALYATQIGQCFAREPSSPGLPSPPPPLQDRNFAPSESLASLSEIWLKLQQALAMDDPDAAIAAYHRFIELAAAPLAGLYRKKAAQLSGLGQSQEATELLEKAISYFPDRPVLTEKLADLYYQAAQDNYQEACRNPTLVKQYLKLCLGFLKSCLRYQRHHPRAMEMKKLLETHKKTGRRRR
jgi:tetratricopeptide (TPR) repeat protein